METIFTIVGVLTALLFGEITVSCLTRIAIARFTRGHGVTVPDYGLMLPEFSGSATLAVLALLGVYPLMTGVAAAVLFAVPALPLARIMFLAVRQGEVKKASVRIGRPLRLMLQTARYLPAKDLHALTGQIGKVRPPAPENPVAGDPATGNPGYRTRSRIRTAPPVMRDARLGLIPHPAAVAAELREAGTWVHSTWGALAEREGTFEPADEDDMLEHASEVAAGILTLAEAFQAQADTASTANGLDPEYIAALLEFADMFAEMAPAATMVIRRYHEVYEGIHEHKEAGGTLPKDADQWFDAEAEGSAEGGAAA